MSAPVKQQWRLVVGEMGNERGHVIPTHARSRHGARIVLGRALALYGPAGWGRIECQASNGQRGTPDEAQGR